MGARGNIYYTYILFYFLATYSITSLYLENLVVFRSLLWRRVPLIYGYGAEYQLYMDMAYSTNDMNMAYSTNDMNMAYSTNDMNMAYSTNGMNMAYSTNDMNMA